ncbi:MAG: anaerobic ribonucleoside-triphosphate reductase activating protein [Treponema sp.]|jgi:anaerobic ribonucleoside-triphosphate reductase activating protein|nr:anaerobic ribonucleoside-triphosphate reductase activating protein [Treponema sp.]
MRLSGITPESFVDGPGLRYVIFTQGCPHQCPHCHNPETWDNNGGKEYSVKQVVRLFKQQKKTKQGVTFSGGEPFLQADELAEAAQAARQMGWDVVTYTGYTYEELIRLINDGESGGAGSAGGVGVEALLYATDILIDGKYVHELRNIELKFRGSSNQRIIDMAKTREKGQVVLWSNQK